MKITREQRSVIYKHEYGQEVEGIKKQIFILSMSISISFLVTSILANFINAPLIDYSIIFISFTLTLYLVIFSLNHIYMNIYHKYFALRETTHKVILANTDPNEFKLSTRFPQRKI